MESVCLVTAVSLQLRRTLFGYARLPGPALAALLVVLLLVTTILTVSHALHQSLHHDGAVSGHVCLVCSFAKGQVSAAAVVVAAALAVFCCVCGIRAAKTSPLPGFDYRLSPSRAPPALASLLSVVA
jgi:hypothetical protein